MTFYILRRSLLALPTLFLVALLVFLLIRMIPGDPAIVLLGEGADAAAIAATHARLGLDKPLPVQFILWLGSVFQGDFGKSIINGQPVLNLVLDRLRLSMSIILPAVGLAVLIAVPFGTYAAWRQGKFADFLIVTLSTLGLSIPSFWLGLMLLMFFGIKLGWLPVVGYV